MRIRTVKPEFWLNEDLAKQDDFARLFALSLLNYADDEGYFNANPDLIRGQVFPFEKNSTRIHRALDELSEIGFVRLADGSNGRRYGQILNFRKHQKIDRPSASRIAPLVTFGESSPSPRPDLVAGTGNREQGTEQGKGAGTRVRAGSHLPAEEESPIRERMVAVNALMNRRETTRWPAKEFTAFKEAGLHELPAEVFADQITPLTAYYAEPVARLQEYWNRPGKEFRRTSLLILLNNWAGEVDRATAWAHWRAKKSEDENRARG